MSFYLNFAEDIVKKTKYDKTDTNSQALQSNCYYKMTAIYFDSSAGTEGQISVVNGRMFPFTSWK